MPARELIQLDPSLLTQFPRRVALSKQVQAVVAMITSPRAQSSESKRDSEAGSKSYTVTRGWDMYVISRAAFPMAAHILWRYKITLRTYVIQENSRGNSVSLLMQKSDFGDATQEIESGETRLSYISIRYLHQYIAINTQRRIVIDTVTFEVSQISFAFHGPTSSSFIHLSLI